MVPVGQRVSAGCSLEAHVLDNQKRDFCGSNQSYIFDLNYLLN